ncbi:sigma D regulator [Alteromonas sp. ASW11-36]|uniref:Sigma D regulator n=1 Tax=Alteromonas arenosi TaxID=3055817 RepID=A0ABT7SU41_9ALTE|nr:sigma D regulator [Alteromonas sp. ASW11-36]MDM7859067.1 sigma D regulator [Alteromonas sp. ASW11-36]
MLSQVEPAAARFTTINTTIDTWLNERQQLLIEYCAIAGLSGNKLESAQSLPTGNDVTQFCEIMMDYVSAGHFEIFDIMASEDPAGEELRNALYPSILETTDLALAFNDRYADVDTIDAPAEFESMVAKLGENLAIRFELEDKLIQHLSDALQASEEN